MTVLIANLNISYDSIAVGKCSSSVQVDEKMTSPSPNTTESLLGSAVPPLQYLNNFCKSVNIIELNQIDMLQSILNHLRSEDYIYFLFINYSLSFSFYNTRLLIG